MLTQLQVGIDTLFFPDAVKGTSLSSPTFEPSPDDIFTSGGPNHPFSAERIYESDSLSMPSHSALRNAVDPAGEIGDSLTQEMMGDLAMDLEAPYRPNISSYDAASNATYSKDEARVDVPVPRQKTAPTDDRKNPHPSASTPAFQTLAIFSGASLLSRSQRALLIDLATCRRGGAICVQASRLSRARDELDRVPTNGRMGTSRPVDAHLGATFTSFSRPSSSTALARFDGRRSPAQRGEAQWRP